MSRKEKLKTFAEAILAYGNGEAIMSDLEFNNLKEELELDGVIPVKTWEEHYAHFAEVNENLEIQDNLYSVPAKSIRPVRTVTEGFDFVKSKKPNTRFIASLKIDGVNTRTDERDGVSRLSITKGRIGVSFNITPGVNRSGQLGKLNTIVLEEAIVTEDDRKEINKCLSEKEYKTGRGTALSILRGALKYPEKVKLFMFNALGFDSLSEALTKGREAGYNVVPFIVFNKEDINDENDIRALMEKISVEGDKLNLMSDGMVIRVDDNKYFEQLGGDEHYDNGAVAIKAERWEQFSNIIGTVTDIKIEPVGVNGSAKLIIEPLEVNGVTLRTINAFNPRVIINNDIRVGDKIIINYKSNSDPDLVGKYKE